MKNKKLIIAIIIGLVIIQARGYYIRNVKVDDVFLTTIAQSINSLEAIRIQNIAYTYDNYVDMHGVLNDDVMSNKSTAEIEIGLCVQGMSKYLYEYNNLLDKKIYGEAEEKIKKYQSELNQLKIILVSYREKNGDIDALWASGVFK